MTIRRFPTLIGAKTSLNDKDFLAQLKEDPTLGDSVSRLQIPLLRKSLRLCRRWTTSDDNSIAFARFVCNYLYPNAHANPDTRHYKMVTPVASNIPIRQVII